MKTRHVGPTRKTTRHPFWAGVVIIAASCAAAAQDLNRFHASESYLADGQTITLTQKLGHAVIQFDPAVTQNRAPNEFTAPNNKRFVLQLDLTPARGLYRMQSEEPVTEASNTETIDSLNTDLRVKYAYPVFAAPGSGMRRFLNDEVVVRTKAPLTPDDIAPFQKLGLKVADTLSPSENIHVLGLLDAKNHNPCSVCSAAIYLGYPPGQ